MKKPLSLLIQLAILCLVTACLPPPAAVPTVAPVTQTSTPTIPPATPTTPPAPVILSIEIGEVLQNPPLTLKGYYPKVDAAGDTRYDGFNHAAENLVSKVLKDFRAEVTDPTFRVDPVAPGSFMEVTYQVLYGENGLVSVLFGIHFYVSGAAHPNQVSRTLNYDASSQMVLELADLFKPGAAYPKILLDHCLNDLKQQQVLQWGENLKADDESLASWSIQADGLRITFDPYSVAPYAMGPQKVIVQYSALKEIINPAGPLNRLVK